MRAVRSTVPRSCPPVFLAAALLLRLDDDVYVAYSVICTHLACEVLWERDTNELFCPCHNGVFDPADGEPVAGPPERPLPRIRLEHRGTAIVAVGEDLAPQPLLVQGVDQVQRPAPRPLQPGGE